MLPCVVYSAVLPVGYRRLSDRERRIGRGFRRLKAGRVLCWWLRGDETRHEVAFQSVRRPIHAQNKVLPAATSRTMKEGLTARLSRLQARTDQTETSPQDQLRTRSRRLHGEATFANELHLRMSFAKSPPRAHIGQHLQPRPHITSLCCPNGVGRRFWEMTSRRLEE